MNFYSKKILSLIITKNKRWIDISASCYIYSLILT